MRKINIHAAKTHLSRLVDEAVAGEPFIIAKAGKPMVQVTPIQRTPMRRIGFLKEEFKVPDDFDTAFAEEIRSMFEDGPLFPDEKPARKK
jgi:prevent-host-death family protein